MSLHAYRRHILKGAGACLALPALESLGYKAFSNESKKQKSQP